MPNIRLTQILSESITWDPKPGPRSPSDDTPKIFQGNNAESLAKELKKLILKYNKQFKKEGSSELILAPVVNYSQSTRQGYLILGVAMTGDSSTYKLPSYRKAESEIEQTILKYTEKKNYEDLFHAGMSGNYIEDSSKQWKSAIVYSVCTAGRTFQSEYAKKLRKIFGI